MSEESSQQSPGDSELNSLDTDEFERVLSEVESSLQSIKERYAQVKRDRTSQGELQQRRDHINRELRRSGNRQNRQVLQTELKQIKEQLATIELNLESRLFSWGSLREPFWQAVRFGGLGVVIGWMLKSCAG